MFVSKYIVKTFSTLVFVVVIVIVIVNAPKNNQCFDEMARKYFQNVSFTLRLESFVGTGVRVLENELFF